jgi:hypothetical protein
MNFWTKLHDFWYNGHTYTKRITELDDFEAWKNFRPSQITNNNWKIYIEFLKLEGFRRR